MQDIAQEQARSYQDAYDREIAGQQAEEQQGAALERTEMIQKAAEARFQANEQLRLQMQASQFDAQAKRTEAQTSRQFTLAEVAQARKSLYDLTSTGRKTLQDIAANPSKYDPTFIQSYAPRLTQALANDEQTVNSSLNSFLSNHKEGDSPNIDFSNLESTKMMMAPLTNPDVTAAMQSKTANTYSLIDSRAQRLQLLKEKASKAATLGAPEKKILDQAAYWGAQSKTLHDNYLDALRTAGGDESNANVKLAKMNWQQAESGYSGYEAELNAAAAQGRIPQSFLTGSSENTPQQASPDAAAPAAAPAAEPTPTSMSGVAAQPNRFLTPLTPGPTIQNMVGGAAQW